MMSLISLDGEKYILLPRKKKSEWVHLHRKTLGLPIKSCSTIYMHGLMGLVSCKHLMRLLSIQNTLLWAAEITESSVSRLYINADLAEDYKAASVGTSCRWIGKILLLRELSDYFFTSTGGKFGWIQGSRCCVLGWFRILVIDLGRFIKNFNPISAVYQIHH